VFSSKRLVEEYPMSIQKNMDKKLREALNIQSLEIINESHHHKNHAGDDGSGESHFSIRICSSDFLENTTINNHKMIYKILEEEMKTIHALKITVIKKTK